MLILKQLFADRFKDVLGCSFTWIVVQSLEILGLLTLIFAVIFQIVIFKCRPILKIAGIGCCFLAGNYCKHIFFARLNMIGYSFGRDLLKVSFSPFKNIFFRIFDILLNGNHFENCNKGAIVVYCRVTKSSVISWLVIVKFR